LLRDWAEYCTTDESYDESNRVLQRILGLSLSKQALETAVQEDATDVEAFYEQKAAPPAEVEGSILVIQADGKGVPMVRTEATDPAARRGKGQKRTQKKESVVTAIYTIAPYLRTPEQVADALLQDAQQASTQPPRPAPVGKEVRATLKGKDFALARLARCVDQRQGSTSNTEPRSPMVPKPCRIEFCPHFLASSWCWISFTGPNTSGGQPMPSWVRRIPIAPPG
jgi:hypothetical protein